MNNLEILKNELISQKQAIEEVGGLLLLKTRIQVQRKLRLE